MIVDVILFVIFVLIVLAFAGLIITVVTTYIDIERSLDEREKLIKKRKAELEKGAK